MNHCAALSIHSVALCTLQGLIVAGHSLALSHLSEDGVTWGLPWNVKLLGVDYLIGVHDLLHYLFGLLLVHFPDFLEAVVV